MLTEELIYTFIKDTVDIVPDTEDSVFLGEIFIPDIPALFGKILLHVTSYYDDLLAILPLTFTERLALQLQRCCTYDEYRSIFNLSIKEHQFSQHAAYRTLLITTNADRLLFISNPDRDESYPSFVDFMQEWSKVHHPLLYALVYEIHDKRTII